MAESWWARGLLFENCNCNVICPGHVHFSQGCTHDTCIGYWAVRVAEGEAGGVDLSGAMAVVAFSSPKVMIEGGWKQIILLNEADPPGKRGKLESILKGEQGGPWGVLARFVAERLPTRAVPIVMEDEGKTKRVKVDGLLDAYVEAIPGRDKSVPVTLENMFNQIHAPKQVVARGSTSFDEPGISFRTEGSHGLFSDFHWKVGS